MSSSSDPDGTGGGSLDSQYYAAQNYYTDLVKTHMPGDTTTDRGIATFQLVISSVLLAIFSLTMMILFLKRNVFEIRARSALLVMLSGACIMVSLFLNILLQRVLIFDAKLDVVPFMCLHHFTLVCPTSCYCSRTVRLIVVFNPGARKSAPSWLKSEWHHVGVCLLLGLASVGFPLYELRNLPDGPFADVLFYVRASETLWRITIASQAVALVLWAFIWKTDDIFNIARELRVAMVLLTFVTLAGKLAEDLLNAPYSRWFNRSKMALLASIIVFYVSVALPILQLLFDPLESPDPKVAEALAKRKESGGTTSEMRRDCEVSPASAEADGRITAADRADAASVIWTYEKVAKVPEVSVAFEKFCRRALCQESVLFLKAVASYEIRFDDDCEAPASESGVDGDDDEYSAFAKIVVNFVIGGAPYDVNLSSDDKSGILEVHRAGRSGFYFLEETERRFLFARAYADVRYVLETNLMTKFVSSEGFKAATLLTGARGVLSTA